MIDLISTVRFLPSYPQLQRPVSISRYGNRAVSFMESGDTFWTVDMQTIPMRTDEALRLQAFVSSARNGMETIVYRPTHMCLPQAYWGKPDHPHIAGPGALGAVTNGTQVQINGVAAGLTLMAGDLISFRSGDYRQMAQVLVGATAASTSITVTIDQPVASYIAPGAVVRFRKPELNTRLVPGSFQMSQGPRPTAQFQLIEVPK
jgi:hypothetical protein